MKKIKLTQNKYTLVDDEDFNWLNQYKWCVYHDKDKPNKFYAVRKENNKTLRMHRKIFKLTNPKIQVDHIDGNGLNNQKINLRICTNQQNKYNSKKHKDNTSGYKGVSWYKNAKKWVAQIYINNKIIYLGYFKSKIDAAKEYDKMAIKHFGEFAHTNFPKESYINEN